MRAIRQIAGVQWLLVFVFGGLVLLSVSSSPTAFEKQELTPEVKACSEGSLSFALELLSKLWNPAANQIVSPFSISSALAMAYGGAKGNTEVQIGQALHFPTNQASLHSGMAALLNSFANLATSGEVELKVTNGLWRQSGYEFKTEFIDLCRKNYHADVEFADLKTGAESARQRINAWMERSTKGKINNLFPPGALNANTRLFIANAIYFKGKWASRFDKGRTQAGTFWVSPEKGEQVPMMSQKSTFLYLLDGDTQVVEMPYRGEGFSMLVLLPKTRDGLPKLEEQLNLENLARWIERLLPADVDVLLPKFKMSSRFSLSQTLAGMGMPDAFDEARADFTGMTDQRPFFINMVEHAATVEVDEEGTVAAAGTGVSFGCSKRPPPVTFHADHPFIFLILERSAHIPLFIGKVVKPGVPRD